MARFRIGSLLVTNNRIYVACRCRDRCIPIHKRIARNQVSGGYPPKGGTGGGTAAAAGVANWENIMPAETTQSMKGWG